MIFKAIEFAAQAHHGHYRKGSRIPYLVHPLAVAQCLLQHDCSEQLAVAAVLHDTVEDTPVTLDQIHAEFGGEIAHLVKAVSEPDKSDTWENRKQHTLETLRTAPTEVLLLTCADKLDNLRSIRQDLEREGDSVWSRFNRPREQQAWYHRKLAGVLVRLLDGEPGATLFMEFQREMDAVFGRG